MLEKIEAKINEIVNAIIAKPISKITKSDFDILALEYNRLKMQVDAEESNKKMQEMMLNVLKK